MTDPRNTAATTAIRGAPLGESDRPPRCHVLSGDAGQALVVYEGPPWPFNRQLARALPSRWLVSQYSIKDTWLVSYGIAPASVPHTVLRQWHFAVCVGVPSVSQLHHHSESGTASWLCQPELAPVGLFEVAAGCGG